MKNVSFGWEADQLNGHSVTAVYPILKPIIIRAYQFTLGLMAWNEGGVFGGSGWSEVLFAAGFSGLPAQTEIGPAVMTDQTGGTWNPARGNVDNGKQNMHGDVNLANYGLCNAIVKAFVGNQSAVNEFIALSNLEIPVPAGSQFTMNAGHAGLGPVDFECQGTLFYDVII